MRGNGSSVQFRATPGSRRSKEAVESKNQIDFILFPKKQVAQIEYSRTIGRFIYRFTLTVGGRVCFADRWKVSRDRRLDKLNPVANWPDAMAA